MRVSAVREDPGFLEDATNWIVLLDGDIMDGRSGIAVVTADEELGIVFGYKLNEHGYPLSENGRFVACERRGKVSLLYRPAL